MIYSIVSKNKFEKHCPIKKGYLMQIASFVSWYFLTLISYAKRTIRYYLSASGARYIS